MASSSAATSDGSRFEGSRMAANSAAGEPMGGPERKGESSDANDRRPLSANCWMLVLWSEAMPCRVTARSSGNSIVRFIVRRTSTSIVPHMLTRM